jgi:hypothetical protein
VRIVGLQQDFEVSKLFSEKFNYYIKKVGSEFDPVKKKADTANRVFEQEMGTVEKIIKILHLLAYFCCPVENL